MQRKFQKSAPNIFVEDFIKNRKLNMGNQPSHYNNIL